MRKRTTATIIGVLMGMSLSFNVQAADYSLFIDVDYNENLLFNTYDVNFYLDGELIDRIQHGQKYTHAFENVSEGAHTIEFASVYSPDVKGQDSFMLTGNKTYACSITSHFDEVEISDAVIKPFKGTNVSVTDKENDANSSEEPKPDVPFIMVQKGDSGDAVKAVQERLIESGFLDGTADGKFGPATETAVMDFQNSKGIAASGIVDEETHNSLFINTSTEGFTDEDALRAAVVSLTNSVAPDVFSGDGNTLDPVKFHSYADKSGFYFNIVSEGNHTQVSESTWHIDDLKLQVYDQDTVMDASLDITLDGNNYVVSNVDAFYYAPNLEEYGTDVGKYYFNAPDLPYVTVQRELVAEDR